MLSGNLTLSIDPEKQNPKRGTLTERVFRKKNPERGVASFVYFSVLWIFFRNDARSRSQKMTYIFVQHDIFPLILAYAI